MAVGAVLAVYAATASWPVVELPLGLVLIGLVLMPVALLCGRPSALLAALVTAAIARLWSIGPAGWTAHRPAEFLLLSLVLGGFLGAAALIELARRRRTEAEEAHAMMDSMVRAATERLEAARRELRAAEAELTEARRQLRRPAAHQPPDTAIAGRHEARDLLDDTFLEARRHEGGV